MKLIDYERKHALETYANELAERYLKSGSHLPVKENGNLNTGSAKPFYSNRPF